METFEEIADPRAAAALRKLAESPDGGAGMAAESALAKGAAALEQHGSVCDLSISDPCNLRPAADEVAWLCETRGGLTALHSGVGRTNPPILLQGLLPAARRAIGKRALPEAAS